MIINEQFGVIFHNEDLDGYTSAAILKDKFNIPAKNMLGFSYDMASDISPEELLDIVRNKGIEWLYIVDFSFPQIHITKLCEFCFHVTLYDHHPDKYELLDLSKMIKNFEAIINNKNCAAVLTWKQLYKNDVFLNIPYFLLLVEDRDLWIWELENVSKPINLVVWANLKILDTDNKRFDYITKFIESKLGSDLIENTIFSGNIILKYQEAMVQWMIEDVFWVTFKFGEELISAPCVNTPIFYSEVSDELLSIYPQAKLSITYRQRNQSGKQKTLVSLRSRIGETDVGEIARYFGGGGHPSAAGFILVDKKFDFEKESI
jgi:oligoribonuclease NrnB/cAMP/cGMP phosphodiesterase (DHH superfamily)